MTLLKFKPWETEIADYDDSGLDIEAIDLSFPEPIVQEIEMAPGTTIEPKEALEIVGISESTLEIFKDTQAIAIDTETTGLERDCKLLGIAFYAGLNKRLWLPVNQINLSELMNILKGKLLIFHNAKFDLEVLSRHGIALDNPIFDTMIAHHLLNENSNHGLKVLAEVLLGEKNVTRYQDLPNNQGHLWGKSPTLVEYSLKDAEYTYRLYELFKPQLETKDLSRLFYEIELPLINIVRGMERQGIRIDSEYLATQAQEYKARLRAIETEIYQLVGKTFDLNSPKQLSEILYDTLGLVPPKITANGARSTDEEALKSLSRQHPIIDRLLEYRRIAKLLSTYIDKLPTLIDPSTGRLHCSFNQTGTVTGRFSSSNPNLQNIPRDSGIRRAFIPSPGYVFIDADFSQIELRCIAHYSQDPRMVKAYRTGQDLHRKTIADMYGKPAAAVTDKERFLAKKINFGLSYGMGAKGLAKETGLSEETAREFINRYFKTYPRVKWFIQKTQREAQEKGCVKNMFGRYRHFTNNYKDAFNSLIQGTAADICKIAMVRLSKVLIEDVRLLLQVHDELLLEVPEIIAEEIKAMVVAEMERPIEDFSIPIKVEAKIGPSWGECK